MGLRRYLSRVPLTSPSGCRKLLHMDRVMVNIDFLRAQSLPPRKNMLVKLQHTDRAEYFWQWSGFPVGGVLLGKVYNAIPFRCC